MKHGTKTTHDECVAAIHELLQEISDEPGPLFSCYCVAENCDQECIDCEIHWCGRWKPPIHISSQLLEKCMKSSDGRSWMKEHLREEIGNLITEEDWYAAV